LRFAAGSWSFGVNGKKRTFNELRSKILVALSSGQQTTNQVSVKAGINWRTVEAHLTFLIGKGLVAEVLKSEYVRIFKLTEQGGLEASSIKKSYGSIHDNIAEEEEVVQT